MRKFSSRLRPRLTRLRGPIIGNIYKYYPITSLTKKESINEGARVKVVTEPRGRGKYKVLDVVQVDRGGDEMGDEFGVLLQDLAIIMEPKKD